MGHPPLNNPLKSAVSVFVEGAKAIPVGTIYSLGIPISHMPGTYNPISLKITEKTLGMTSVMRSLSHRVGAVAGAKAVFDAGVYVGALAVCLSGG